MNIDRHLDDLRVTLIKPLHGNWLILAISKNQTSLKVVLKEAEFLKCST